MEDVLSAKDLQETIQAWLRIYKDITRPDINNNEMKDKYTLGMMKVVSALYVVQDIEKTPIEKHLRKAIEEAKSGDFSKLDTISVFLSEVDRYLGNKDLN